MKLQDLTNEQKSQLTQVAQELKSEAPSNKALKRRAYAQSVYGEDFTALVAEIQAEIDAKNAAFQAEYAERMARQEEQAKEEAEEKAAEAALKAEQAAKIQAEMAAGGSYRGLAENEFVVLAYKSESAVARKYVAKNWEGKKAEIWMPKKALGKTRTLKDGVEEEQICHSGGANGDFVIAVEDFFMEKFIEKFID